MHPEFPLDDSLIHLNHAAVGPWPRRTAEAVSRFAYENMHEGSRHFMTWLAREQTLREQLARLINAPSSAAIGLLKSTSEGLSVVAYGLDWQPGDNVISLREEFPSNRIVWESLARLGVTNRQLTLADIAADPEAALIAAIDARTRLLAVSSVQYASGLRLDLTRLGAACRARGIAFCVDAIQHLGALPFDVQATQADFVVADAHKWLLGPEGIAVFYCAEPYRSQLTLYQYGWHMVEALGDFERFDWQPATSARRFECGSANNLGIQALAASVSLLLETGMDSISAAVLENARYLRTQLSKQGAQILSPSEPNRHSGIVTFRLPGVDSTAVYQHLTEQGVLCAQRGGGIRFSPHFYTAKADLDRALEILTAAALP